MNNTNYNKNLIDLQDDTIEITNIIKTNCEAVNIITKDYNTKKINI